MLDDFFGVKELLYAQAITRGAGTGGIVEGEQSRFQFTDGIPAQVTGVAGRKGVLFSFIIHGGDQGDAVGQAKGGFKAFCQPLFKPRLDLEAVHDHVNLVFAFLVQRREVIDIVNPAVDSQANEALASHGVEHILVFTLAVPDDRRKDHQFAVLGHGQNLIHHLTDGLGFQWQVVVRATRLTGPGKQQAQVIVDFSDGADGGARVVGGALLLNGNGRRQSLNMVYIGLFHHRQELASIGGQRLHVAALAFGIERVERKG